ncbi:hypothetical protein OG21DRAFT_1038867 [Imleria badia]|nr:hypothetical protein OG21DRAFT_1038867 [Imleria badia]
MPKVTTEIANAVVTHNDGHMPHFTTANSQPFVVSSVSTKRYAPAIKTLVQRLSPIPPPTPTAERLSVPRGTPTKQASRSASISTVVPKAESRHPSPKSSPIPAPQMMARVRKSPPLLLAPSTDRSLREKTFVAKPLNIVQKLKGGKLMDGCTASVTRRSTQVTTADELPPRPSCVPRSRVWESVFEVSRARQDVWVKVSTTGPRNPRIPRRKPSVNIGNVKTAGRVKATDATCIVAGSCRTGMPTRKRRLTAPKPIVYPQAIIPVPDIAWSPPPSPYLSSFPSQTWTIVVDETLSSTPKSSVAGMPNDSWGPSEVISPLILSPSLTAFETLASPERSTVGSDGMISSPTKGPSAEVSHTVCAATIISPSRNGSASSMATLAKVIDSQASSSTGGVSESGNKTRTTVQCAFEIAKTIFSPSRRASQSSPVTTSSKTMGTNVSRIRKLFIPQLDKDVKASKNPMTQIEIEILRAEKVAGGEEDPLDRLGSLTALAIVRKLVTSGSDSSSQF